MNFKIQQQIRDNTEFLNTQNYTNYNCHNIDMISTINATD
jgi:hypothetical protein